MKRPRPSRQGLLVPLQAIPLHPIDQIGVLLPQDLVFAYIVGVGR